MRSAVASRILAIKTNKVKKIRKPFSLAFQLGMYIGEYIYRQYLPALDCDMMHSKVVVKVLPEEFIEHKRLNDAWFNKYNEDQRALRKAGVKYPDLEKVAQTEWKECKDYEHMLAQKYLPHVLDCHVHHLDVRPANVKQLKAGIRLALWDCDMCQYHVEKDDDIEILKDELGWTVIRLKLDMHDRVREQAS
jgi:hypothetical protein